MAAETVLPTSLADLIAPIGEDELRRHIRARRPLYLPASDPDRFAGLFGWKQLEDGIARGLFQGEDLRLFIGGNEVSKAAMGAQDKAGRIKPQAVQSLVRQGADIVVNNAQICHTPLWDLACDCQKRLGDKVSIGAIASSGLGPTLPIHYDVEDLLAVQIAGTKHWTFYGEAIEGSGRQRPMPSRPTEITGTLTMRPGDVLFVPSGLHHQCRPEGMSFQLGLLIERRTGLDFIKYLSGVVAQDPAFADPIPVGQGADAVAAYEERLKRHLMGIIANTSLGDMLDRQDRQHNGAASIDLLGRRDLHAPGTIITLIGLRQSAPLPDGAEPAFVAALSELRRGGRVEAATLLSHLSEAFGPTMAHDALLSLLDRGLACLTRV